MKEIKKVRGVFEKVPGSDVWWIQYFDTDGRRRREKAGTRSNAIDLVRKRKTEALSGKKLPEKIRARVVRFEELATDGETYCKANNQGQQFDLYRIGRLREEFGTRPANIPIEDLRQMVRRAEVGERDAQPIQDHTLSHLPAGDREWQGAIESCEAA